MTEFHFWLSSKDPSSGKPYLVYVCPAREGEGQARQRGLELLNGLDFTIHRLKTRDLDTASSILRGKRLERTHSLKKASQRIGHTKTVARDKKRRTHKKDNSIAPLW